MAAFDSAVMQRSEEVKRSENQRQMPGWNFCTFFILKVYLHSGHIYFPLKLIAGKSCKFLRWNQPR